MYPKTGIQCLFLCMAILFVMGFETGSELDDLVARTGKDPTSYLAEKATANRLVLLGTRHDSRQGNDLILNALPFLAGQAGVTVLFVEIPTSQQGAIDLFSRDLGPAGDIRIPDIIGGQGYPRIITRARELGMEIVAIDADEGSLEERDRWMAGRVSEYFALHSAARGLVVVGNSHVYRNVAWAHGGCPTMAERLRELKPFSVVMWPEAIDRGAPVALDVDARAFLGLKDPTLQCMNVNPRTCLATTADGVILLGKHPH